jgi:hypothetical protein
MNFRHLSDTSCVLLLQRHFFTFPTETKDLPISEFEKSQGKVAGKDAQSFHMPNDLNPIFPGYKVGCLICSDTSYELHSVSLVSYLWYLLFENLNLNCQTLRCEKHSTTGFLLARSCRNTFRIIIEYFIIFIRQQLLL